MPLPNRGELFDVLVGTANEIDIRFYFSQQDGKIAAAGIHFQ